MTSNNVDMGYGRKSKRVESRKGFIWIVNRPIYFSTHLRQSWPKFGKRGYGIPSPYTFTYIYIGHTYYVRESDANELPFADHVIMELIPLHCRVDSMYIT